jgi:hypothetical protein
MLTEYRNGQIEVHMDDAQWTLVATEPGPNQSADGFVEIETPDGVVCATVTRRYLWKGGAIVATDGYYAYEVIHAYLLRENGDEEPVPASAFRIVV